MLLHVLSPEFAPSWRMVSEYANGQYRWLLTLVFSAWALSSFALLAALWPASATTLGKVGLLFLLLAGIGQAMGALFDVNHPLHGAAAMIGIPSLCAGGGAAQPRARTSPRHRCAAAVGRAPAVDQLRADDRRARAPVLRAEVGGRRRVAAKRSR